MDKRLPLVIVDDNAELRSALERELSARARAVIARPAHETRDGEETTRSFLEIPSTNIGDALLMAWRYGEAIAQYRRTHSLSPKSCPSPPQFGLGATLGWN